MAIDYSSLLGLGAGIQVVKGHYDHARDGGTIGRVDPSAPALPLGALVIGIIAYTTEAITFDVAGVIEIGVGDALPLTVSAGLNYLSQVYPTDADQPALVREEAPRVDITVGNVTAGAFTFWILYLPT